MINVGDLMRAVARQPFISTLITDVHAVATTVNVTVNWQALITCIVNAENAGDTPAQIATAVIADLPNIIQVTDQAIQDMFKKVLDKHVNP